MFWTIIGVSQLRWLREFLPTRKNGLMPMVLNKAKLLRWLRGGDGEEVNRGRLIAWKRNWEGSHSRTAVTIVSGASIPSLYWITLETLKFE